ncbi:MAG: acyl-CoA dehydratase activase [Clostridiales Family XIII bacterium]|nr:acyl-CoA dehydratase activase [Clostridiales Family XIII bacterium]
MYLGIDIGSSSSKAAILDAGKTLVASCVVNMGTGTNGPGDVLAEALRLAGIDRGDVRYTVATGYGRILYDAADKQITEISCHAKGIHYLMEEGVRTVVDIGGQDAKVIKLDAGGSVVDFVMNEKCAAGTGRFLEVMARVLGCGIQELSDLAGQARNDIPISSVCTVFAESEVISRLASGAAREDVAKGAHASIAKRISGMCNRIGYAPIIAMSGGVALNRNMVKMLGNELGEPVVASPHPQEVGAIGAAVYAYERAAGKDGGAA